ncbi:uncharacterized protein LOC135401634 [Ornithodoros turicata]
MSGLTKHLSTHVYFHMDRSHQPPQTSAPPKKQTFSYGGSRKKDTRPPIQRTRSDMEPPPLGYPLERHYEPSCSEWDDFDYFCQSPYLLASPQGARERPKRSRLFRRSHKEKYEDDALLDGHRLTGRGPSRYSETPLAEPRDGSWRRQPSTRASSTSRRSPVPQQDHDEDVGVPRGATQPPQDCFIVSARTMERFLPAFGQDAVERASSSASSSCGAVSVEVAECCACIVVDLCENAGFTCHDLPSPTTDLAPMPRDWIALQLGRQRQAFAWLRESPVREGLLLMNVERNSQFPFVTYLVCDSGDPDRLILQMESHHATGPDDERLHHTAAYEEVATIARPPVDMLPKKPTTDKTGYILSAFRVFPGEDREKLDRSWLLWTGARQIYRRLPPHLGLRRITFHKKVSPVDHGITYILLCECPTLMDYVPEACVLVDQLRARCCGYTALYRIVDAF